MRSGLSGLVVVLGCLGLAPTASATNFYVDDGAPAANAACSQAAPCNTLQKAVTASAADAAPPHTVNLAPGTYTESSISFGSVNHTGLRLLGAGSGDDPSTDTILKLSASGSGLGLGALSGPQTGMRAQGIRVEAPITAVSATGSTLEDMAFISTSPTATSVVLKLQAPGQLLDRVTVRGGPESSGIYMQESSPSTTDYDWILRDVDVVAGKRGGVEARDDQTGNLLLQRARVTVPSVDSSVALSTQGPMTVESSLIAGGSYTAIYGNTASPVLLRNVTADAGVPGRADPPATGMQPFSVTGSTVRALSSILLEAAGGGARCESSNVRSAPGTQCAVGDNGNISSTPGQLFMAPGADWRLLPGAPAVDTGAAAGLGSGESVLDLARAPRVLDGNGDGLARRDQGAYELRGPPTGSAATDTVRPRVRSARFRPRRFRPGKRSTRVGSAKRATPRGSKLGFRLSEKAVVRVRIERALKGRRVGRKCRPATRRRRAKPRCVRWKKVVTLTRKNVKPGKVTVRFSGRLRRKALRPGRYRAVIVATDGARNRSKSTRAGFVILRR